MIGKLHTNDLRKKRPERVAIAVLAIVWLAGCRTAAGVDLFVDFGVADEDGVVSSTPNQIQSGFSGFSAVPEFDGTPVSDFANTLTTSRNISGVSVTLLGGGNGLFFNDLVTEVNHALGDLAEDGVSTADVDLTITLDGLTAGTYQWTGYHHVAVDSGLLPFDIYVDSGSGESLAASDVGVSSGFNPASIMTSSFSFSATGADVVVRLDGGSNPTISTFLSGFAIVEVPEPSGILLLALGLIPLVALCRRVQLKRARH